MPARTSARTSAQRDAHPAPKRIFDAQEDALFFSLLNIMDPKPEPVKQPRKRKKKIKNTIVIIRMHITIEFK